MEALWQAILADTVARFTLLQPHCRTGSGVVPAARTACSEPCPSCAIITGLKSDKILQENLSPPRPRTETSRSFPSPRRAGSARRRAQDSWLIEWRKCGLRSLGIVARHRCCRIEAQ